MDAKTQKPEFITFTGVDDDTLLDDMESLSLAYPIEWGVLFSPKRQGSGRYPSLGFVRQLVTLCSPYVVLSAHLCGGDARSVIEFGESLHDALIFDRFNRAQINTADESVQPRKIAAWAEDVKVRAILQCRGPFPRMLSVDTLFDASGGRGISPSSWPEPPVGAFVGYAGGLSPENVSAAVEQIGAMAEKRPGTSYWIDMESGVRDANDRFDLSKCRAVCEAVYGDPA